jgi:hypothetical protein
VDIEQCTLDKDKRFLDPKSLLDICTCLITFQEGADPEVRLAHYTVQEYLFSERMKVTFFKTSENHGKGPSRKNFCHIPFELGLRSPADSQGVHGMRYRVV